MCNIEPETNSSVGNDTITSRSYYIELLNFFNFLIDIGLTVCDISVMILTSISDILIQRLHRKLCKSITKNHTIYY